MIVYFGFKCHVIMSTNKICDNKFYALCNLFDKKAVTFTLMIYYGICKFPFLQGLLLNAWLY